MSQSDSILSPRPSPKVTYVLIHGAGSDSWYWHLVVPRLEARGHDVVTMDLPVDDDSAGFEAYADTVIDAIDAIDDRGDRGEPGQLVVVAQSLAGFTAPIVCTRVRVDLLILVAAMVPLPGESAGEWWVNTGQAEAKRKQAERDGRTDSDDPVEMFLHDAPREIIEESEAHVRPQSGTPFEKPWPLPAWPDVPTRFLLCRDDRLFPADFMRRVAAERLGIVPDEMAGGHLPALAHPDELVDRLESLRVKTIPSAGTVLREGEARGPSGG